MIKALAKCFKINEIQTENFAFIFKMFHYLKQITENTCNKAAIVNQMNANMKRYWQFQSFINAVDSNIEKCE